MLKTRWSKQELIARFGSEESFSAVIDAFEKETKEQGSVLCGIWLNDLVLSEEDEKRFAETKVEQLNSFRFTVAFPEDLVSGLMKDWIDLLPQIVGRIEQLSEVIRFSGIENSFKRFTDIIDASSYFITSLREIKNYITRHQLTLDSNRWTEEEAGLARTMQDITYALESKDYIQLSDLLEYDLNTSLQNWLEIMVKSNELLKSQRVENEKPIAQDSLG